MPTEKEVLIHSDPPYRIMLDLNGKYWLYKGESVVGFPFSTEESTKAHLDELKVRDVRRKIARNQGMEL